MTEVFIVGSHKDIALACFLFSFPEKNARTPHIQWTEKIVIMKLFSGAKPWYQHYQSLKLKSHMAYFSVLHFLYKPVEIWEK